MRFLLMLLAYLFALSAGAAIADVSAPGPKAPRSMLICYLSSPDDYQARSAGAAIARMLRYRASNLPQFSNLPPFNVVERVLQQEGLSPRLSLDLPASLRIARATGQEWAVVGTAKREKDIFSFTLEIHGAYTGNIIGKPLTVEGEAHDLPLMERDLAKALFGGIGLQLTEEQESDLGKTLTDNYAAVRLLGDHLLAAETAASGLLDKALVADLRFPVTAVHRIERALDSGRYSDAIMIAREWRRRLPGNRDFPSCEFGALLATGKYAAAASLLDTMDANYPDSFSLTLLRYWLCSLQDDHSGALLSANRLVVLNSNSPEAHTRVCEASLDNAIRAGSILLLSQMTPDEAAAFAGAVDSAVKAGERAVKLDVRYQDAWLWLMAAYRERGDYNKCEQAFRRLMSLNAAHRGAKLGQALSYLCQGKTAPARSLLEALASVAPKDPEVFLALAVCHEREGDDTSAKERHRMAISLDKTCADVKYLRVQRRWPVELARLVADMGN